MNKTENRSFLNFRSRFDSWRDHKASTHVLGLLHFETMSKACFRKLVRNEEAKLSRKAG